jgi:hypothetical protein
MANIPFVDDEEYQLVLNDTFPNGNAYAFTGSSATLDTRNYRTVEFSMLVDRAGDLFTAVRIKVSIIDSTGHIAPVPIHPERFLVLSDKDNVISMSGNEGIQITTTNPRNIVFEVPVVGDLMQVNARIVDPNPFTVTTGNNVIKALAIRRAK